MLIPRKTLPTCLAGVIGVAMLGGLVGLPTSADASTGVNVVSETRSDVATIESDLRYAPGGQLHLSGTGAPNTWVEIIGLPTGGPEVSGPSHVAVDHLGRWTVSTPSGADEGSYDIVVTPVRWESAGWSFAHSGEPVARTLVADATYSTVERDLQVTDGLSVEAGAKPVLSGVSNAFSPVQVEFAGGAVRGQADHLGRWSVVGAQPLAESERVRVLGNEEGRVFSSTITAEIAVQDSAEVPGDGGDGGDESPVSPLRVTSGDEYVVGQRITVTGKNTPGEAVELRDAKGKLLRTLSTNAAGDWRFTTNGAYTAPTVTWKFVSGDHAVTHTLTGV